MCLPTTNAGSSSAEASATPAVADAGTTSEPEIDSPPAPDSAATGASVFGTLTLPASAPGKPFVAILALEAENVITDRTATVMQSAPAGTTIDYRFDGVPAGTYYLLTYVDVDESGGDSSTPGDFVGWYDPTNTGNPPASGPNVVVPESGSVEYSFNMIER